MKKIKERLIIPTGFTPGDKVLEKVDDFLDQYKTYEQTNEVSHILLFDERSGAFYLICHLPAKVLALASDLDAVLDPTESEEYKLNRQIYTDTYAYRLMEADALEGRSFEDLVVEYDTSYRHNKPLKVFGGQHRINAITQAIEHNAKVPHGVRVYFNLTTDQKVDIAMANNTSIVVPNDLLDRMQEDLLGADLRKWCQSVGLLDKDQNFADRRSSEGVPSVRIARTLLVNFYRGKNAKEVDEFHTPIVCSSGPGIDEDYRKLRDTINWKDKTLRTMGVELAKLHKLQRKRVRERKDDAFTEFANKAIHPSVTASWAYAAGLFQRRKEWLEAHYAIADSVSPPADPLGAKALLEARLKGVDPDKYRGLGARINKEELGRMLELFLLQATKAKKRGISLKLANTAIQSYQAKKHKFKTEKALETL